MSYDCVRFCCTFVRNGMARFDLTLPKHPALSTKYRNSTQTNAMYSHVRRTPRHRVKHYQLSTLQNLYLGLNKNFVCFCLIKSTVKWMNLNSKYCMLYNWSRSIEIANSARVNNFLIFLFAFQFIVKLSLPCISEFNLRNNLITFQQ